MNWIYGFFMAWGMFLAIPCPFPRWQENARRHMLACLPLMGGVVGGLWVLMAYLSQSLPAAIGGLFCAVMPWLTTGFLHLDGYMDVCDAILSRRNLERRQKILKDSHCGAFAVICLVLLVLAQWCVCFSVTTLPWPCLLCIPVASRACCAMGVLWLKPMAGSQYAAMPRGGAFWILPVVLLLISIVPCALYGYFAPLVTAAVWWLCALCGKRQLGGMNGDISGFALTVSELAGLMVLGVMA